MNELVPLPIKANTLHFDHHIPAYSLLCFTIFLLKIRKKDDVESGNAKEKTNTKRSPIILQNNFPRPKSPIDNDPNTLIVHTVLRESPGTAM